MKIMDETLFQYVILPKCWHWVPDEIYEHSPLNVSFAISKPPDIGWVIIDKYLNILWKESEEEIEIINSLQMAAALLTLLHRPPEKDIA